MIETDRLLIQKFTIEESLFMLELLNTPAWLEFIGDRNVRTLDEARQYILDGAIKSYDQFGFGSYVVKLKASCTPIGICGLFRRDSLDDVDIGFAFLPDYTRSGYGYESASAVMAYAIDKLGLTRITGLTSALNQNSIRLLEKLGLRFEKKIHFRPDGTETLVFGLTLPDK